MSFLLLPLLLHSDSSKMSTAENPLGMNDAWRACEFTVNAEYKNQYVMLGKYVEMFLSCSAATHTKKHNKKRR